MELIKTQIKRYLTPIAVTDETAPAGGIFKVKLICTIRPQNIANLKPKQD